MKNADSTVAVSPRVGALLSQVAETSDLETALLKVLSEYITLKAESLEQRIQLFEAKWGMTFAEFARRCEAETVGQDAYGYEVERDFWEWEQAETLRKHYEDLQARWM